MRILSHLMLRTKLSLLLGLSALAVVASVGLGAWQLQQRMLDDRIDKLRATTQMILGWAQALEQQVVAGQLTHQAAVAQLAAAVHVMHFDNGDGYIGFQSRDGLVLAHGGNPKLEGKPAGGRNSSGRSTSDLAWAALQAGDEGVIFYSTPRPGQTEPQPKVGYVAQFAPWDVLAIASAYTDDLDTEFRRSLLRLCAAGGIILLISLLAAWLVNRDIAVSLGSLKGAMDRLAKGDHGTAVPGTDRRDEVGGMAAAVLVFKDSMIETERLRAAQEASKRQAAAEQKAALNRMADGFESKIGRLVGDAFLGCHGAGSHRAVDDRHGEPRQPASRRGGRGGGRSQRRVADRGLGCRGTDRLDRRDQPPGRAIVEDHRPGGG